MQQPNSFSQQFYEGDSYSHFTDQETKAQKGDITLAESGVEPRQSEPKVHALTSK